MLRRVAIVGIGRTSIRPISPELSFKEILFEACVKAYEDAGLCPRTGIDSFIHCGEDWREGRSIADIHIPDQVGAVLKPIHTIAGEGIQGIGAAFMQISAGIVDTAAVVAYSKESNLLTHGRYYAMCMDPNLNRPLAFDPFFIAGLEMRRYLYESGGNEEYCALVVVKNKRNAIDNPFAAYGMEIGVEDVLSSEPVATPLKRLDMSEPADGAFAVVLAAEDKLGMVERDPIWIKGISWNSDAPSLETRCWGEALYARLAAEKAYKMAGISDPRKELDFAEVDDTFSYKELQHIEALLLARRGEVFHLLERGAFSRGGEFPVNPSGGSLGKGYHGEAMGLERVCEAVSQLRGEAGEIQIDGVKRAVVQSWRGIPLSTGGVIILEKEGR